MVDASQMPSEEDRILADGEFCHSTIESLVIGEQNRPGSIGQPMYRSLSKDIAGITSRSHPW
jgi:hypothetical protein